MPRPVDPYRRGTLPPRRSRALLPTAAVLVALAVALGVFTSFWTDRLWYESTGYLSVFNTTLVTRAVLFAVFGLLMAAAVALNAIAAYRLRPRYRAMSVEQQSLDRYRDAIDPIRRWVVVGLAGVLGLMAGGSAAGQWRTYLQWQHGVSFDQPDPEFGMDVSFYVFDYPWWRFLVGFGFATVVISLVVAVVAHYVYGGIRLQSSSDKVSPAAQAHISVLIGLFVLLKAVAYWLDRYGLLLSEHDLFTGASYTDIKALLPAKTILTFIALICALLFFANVVRRSWTLPGIGLGLLLLSAVLLGGLWPAIVQQFQVGPNEAELENPYIGRNIEATRDAYGLTAVQVDDYDATTQASAPKLRDDAETLPGIRLLDPTLLSPTYQQLQQVRGFYTFPDPLDVDRYEVDGQSRDMVVALREVELSGVPVDQQNWINEHTVYTHGYGMVAAYGNERSPAGAPVWSEEDLPPRGVLGDYQPRVYFGEFSPQYSIVGAPEGVDPVEFDVPEDAQGVQANYTYGDDGEAMGGVPIGSLFNRLLYAMKYQEGNILLSDRINPASKILYEREPRERVLKVAPWLQVDGDPYPAVVDGRIVWIVDGYTTADGYPYAERVSLDEATSDATTVTQTNVVAQPQEEASYIRNSVKATVDAYSGAVTLYAWDQTDPVLQTWQAAFPDTVKTEIPPALLAHLRYPEDLFKVQRTLLTRYHVTDAAEFYTGDDFWIVPNDPTSDLIVAQPPFYLTLQMPGQQDPAFSLTTTFVPRGRENLASFMAVNADASSKDYGTLRVLRLPSTTQVEGPNQVANTFESDTAIAEATLALRQSGADTREGNLLTLPVGGGLLYVQPVYVERQSGTASYPLLRLVLVSFGNKVGFGRTLDEALSQVFTGEINVNEDPSAEPNGDPGPGGVDAAVLDALADAQQAFEDSQAALKAGDFAAYGAAVERLGEALERAEAAQSGGAAAP